MIDYEPQYRDVIEGFTIKSRDDLVLVKTMLSQGWEPDEARIVKAWRAPEKPGIYRGRGGILVEFSGTPGGGRVVGGIPRDWGESDGLRSYTPYERLVPESEFRQDLALAFEFAKPKLSRAAQSEFRTYLGLPDDGE